MVFFSRDSLRSDLHKTSKQATALEQTSIEDRRRKLEERLNRFHQKAEEFMGENADEDLDVLPQFTGWENDTEGDEQEFSDAWEEDEEENSENPEMTAICLPSSLKPTDIQRLGLGVLATQELELRKGRPVTVYKTFEWHWVTRPSFIEPRSERQRQVLTRPAFGMMSRP